MRVSDIKNFRLKPCPFCGGKYTPTLYDNEDDDLDIDEYISRVECDFCGATIEGAMADSLLEADINAAMMWNNRAETAVNVVHCKDCKYWLPHTQCGFDEDNDEYHNYCNYHMPEDEWYAEYWEADDYCSHGELKEVSHEHID